MILLFGDFVLCQGESGSGASLGARNQLGASVWRCRYRQLITDH
jgi:hypothetical protein